MIGSGRPWSTLLCCLLTYGGSAQQQGKDRTFRFIGLREGLPSAHITALAPHSAGGVWVGTTAGLAYTDGLRCVPLAEWIGTERTDLPGHITALAAHDRTLYIGTQGQGIYRLDLPDRSIHRVQMAIGKRNRSLALRIQQILVHDRGTAYIGTETGLATLTENGDSIRWIDGNHPGGPIDFHGPQDMAWSSSGDTLWIAGQAELIRYDHAQGIWGGYALKESATRSNNVRAYRGMQVDDKGRSWSMDTGSPRLVRIDPFNHHVEAFDIREATGGYYSEPSNRCFRLDATGTLWIGHWRGPVILFNTQTGSVDTTLYSTWSERPLPGRLNTVHTDEEGRAWLGTDGGLYVEQQGAYRTVALTPLRPAIGAQNAITGAVPFGSSIYIGTRQGLYRQQGEDIQRLTMRGRDAPSAEDINALYADASGLYILGYQGLWRVDTSDHHLVRVAPELERLHQGPKVEAMLTARDGSVWVSTWNQGLFHLQEDGATRIPFSGTEGRHIPHVVLAIAEHADGSILLGCNGGGGVWRWDPKSNVFAPFCSTGTRPEDLRDGSVSSLLITADGTTYVGTLGGGITVISPAGTVEHIGVREGLLSEVVHRLLVDDRDGRILVTGPQGTGWYDPTNGKVGEVESRFPRRSTELSHAGRIDKAGRYVLYSDDLLILLEPQHQPLPLPNVYVAQMRVNDQRWDPSMGKPLTFDQNNIRFDISAIDPDARLRELHYRLDGLDSTWHTLKGPDRVEYLNLPDGTFTFRTRGVDDQGMVLAEERIPFRIAPPYWRTWWFAILIVSALITVGYGIASMRHRHARQLQHARNTIARDLHDDVGASLSSIQVYSEMAHTLADTDPQRTKDLLDRIRRTARSSITGMSDIVWAMQPQHDKADDLVLRMKDHASDVLEAAGIDHRFDVDGIDQLRLSIQARRDLHMVFKEAVNNAIKHSGAKQVTITFRCAKGLTLLEVSDNGAGLVGTAQRGNGLRSMRSRVEERGGIFTIESSEEGTRMTAVWKNASITDTVLNS